MVFQRMSIQISESKVGCKTDFKGKELMDAVEVPLFQIPNQAHDPGYLFIHKVRRLSIQILVPDNGRRKAIGFLLLHLCHQSQEN